MTFIKPRFCTCGNPILSREAKTCRRCASKNNSTNPTETDWTPEEKLVVNLILQHKNIIVELRRQLNQRHSLHAINNKIFQTRGIKNAVAPTV